MSGKWRHFENTAVRRVSAVASIALLCLVVATPVLSQGYDDADDEDQADAAELNERFEAERRRQQQVQFEKERRRQEQVRFENERIRLENERAEQERLRLANERLRQENERSEQERLRLDNERLRQQNQRYELERLRTENTAREREIAQAAALAAQAIGVDQNDSVVIYEQLRMLGQLRDEGVLSEEEFQRLKKRILE